MITAPILDFDVSNDVHALLWQRSIEHLREAIPRLHGTHNELDILSMIHGGHLDLWPGEKASGITEVVIYPRMLICNVFLVGGRGGLNEVEEWVKRGGVLEEYAFGSWGCQRITLTGRKGWARKVDAEPMGEMFMRDNK